MGYDIGKPIMKSKLLISILLASAAGVSSQNALAESPDCSLNGIVSGSGTLDGQSVTFDFGSIDTASPTWWSGTAEGALGLNCGLFNAQIDAAYTSLSTGAVPASDPNQVLGTWASQAHYGGAIFLRDPNVGAFGVSASRIVTSASLTRLGGTFGGDGGETRIGAFGEYYTSDNFTVGASLHHFEGAFPYFNNQYHGFELAAFGKYYASTDLSFTGRVDALLSNLEFNTGPFPINGVAVTLGSEYRVADTGLSLFADGTYSSRRETSPTSSDTVKVDDFAARVGLKFAFGGGSTHSLVGRDRSSTYDNTSLFLEKLPDFISSAPN